ncbi:MAG TPA: alpha/beta hydrolase [Pseudomonadales bacterium]|nr:alpha/beta hydrolase [Pseudomonadales bacterium]
MNISGSFPADWAYTRVTRFTVTSQAGIVELLVNGVQKPRAVALICHPHPLHGGSLDNKVVFTLARACRDSGIVAVRFNFRGVGCSTGVHDNGVGELDDANLVLSCISLELPGLPIVLAGFSFGAAIVAQLAQTTPCAGLLLSTPPVPRYGLDKIATVAAPVLLLQCDDDEVVDSATVYNWFEQLSAPQKMSQQWPKGGHFFHGMLTELKSSAEKFLSVLPI